MNCFGILVRPLFIGNCDYLLFLLESNARHWSDLMANLTVDISYAVSPIDDDIFVGTFIFVLFSESRPMLLSVLFNLRFAGDGGYH